MIYVLFADGFEEIEGLCCVDILRRGGVDVTTVSVNDTTAVHGSHHITVQADITSASLAESKAYLHHTEAVIFPGGMPGSEHLHRAPITDILIEAAQMQNSYLCAICAAPIVLARRGLLSGIKATCYPSFMDELRENGAKVSPFAVVHDGRFITASGMGAAMEFGFAILRAVRSAETEKQVRTSILA